MSSRLYCILESLADGVLVVNTHFYVERCNPAAENLLNLPRSYVEGRPYDQIMNGLGDLEKLKTAIEQGRTVLDEQRTRFQQAVDEGRQAAARKKDELLAHLNPEEPEQAIDLGEIDA